MSDWGMKINGVVMDLGVTFLLRPSKEREGEKSNPLTAFVLAEPDALDW